MRTEREWLCRRTDTMILWQKTHRRSCGEPRGGEVFHSQLFTDRGRHALNYFLDRGLTMETIRHFGLGFAPDDWRALKITSMNRALTIFCSRVRIFCAAATKTEKYLITTTSATA